MNAADRIKKYCDERAKMARLDPEQIAGLHVGHETREALLTVSDLRAVLAQCDALLAAAKDALGVIPPHFTRTYEALAAAIDAAERSAP